MKSDEKNLFISKILFGDYGTGKSETELNDRDEVKDLLVFLMWMSVRS